MYHSASQNVTHCVTKGTTLRHKMYYIAPQNVPYCATKYTILCQNCTILRHKSTTLRHKMYHMAPHNAPYCVTKRTTFRHKMYYVYRIMYCTRPSSGPPLSQGILGGGGGLETKGKIQDTSNRIYSKQPLLF